MRGVVQVVASEAQAANASPECTVVATRSPSPTGTSHDGQVVVSEAVDGGDGANEETKQDIETVVAEVEPSRGSDEDGQTEGDKSNGQQVDGRGSSLSSNRLKSRVVLSVAADDSRFDRRRHGAKVAVSVAHAG